MILNKKQIVLLAPVLHIPENLITDEFIKINSVPIIHRIASYLLREHDEFSTNIDDINRFNSFINISSKITVLTGERKCKKAGETPEERNPA